MHDQSLEQRLRGALQAEGDRLPLTITAAELERRLAHRRPGDIRRFASLGLAAAIGIALIGLAGVAGGWFDQRAIGPAPLPSTSAAPSSGPVSLPPSSSPADGRLPSLDDLLAPLDPARIVRAQAVGPAAGSGDGLGPLERAVEPGSVTFAPVTVAGAYRLWSACLGSDGIVVRTVRGIPTQEVEQIPITCDGAVSVRQVGLEAGDALAIATAPGTGHSAWRVVLEAPERLAHHATELRPPSASPPDGWDELATGTSQGAVPSYLDNRTGGGVLGPVAIGSAPPRDRYRVEVACAGPSTLRYTLGSTIRGTGTAKDGTIDAFVTTEVECDGLTTLDAIDIPLPVGAEVFVTADERLAWRVSVLAEAPPIALEPNGGGWGMAIGAGPDLHFDGMPAGLSSMSDPTVVTEIRVVVTCLGGSFVDVKVHAREWEDPPLAAFRADCSAGEAQTTAQTVRLTTPTFLVETDPEGKMWLAVTVQERLAPSPAP